MGSRDSRAAPSSLSVAHRLTYAHRPMPVITSRSGRWPWQTTRVHPSSGHLGLDHLRQETARPTGQDFGELILEGPWFNQLNKRYRSTRHIAPSAEK